ncbi:MAG TPA: LysR family transcriptional regulator [Acidimicrobiales bacterium]
MDLDRLESFLMLVEELHFGRAARRLHMSQSGFSRQIGLLERSLGVRLAIRTRRQVQLTDAGVVFAAKAARLLSEMGYVKAAVVAMRTLPIDS